MSSLEVTIDTSSLLRIGNMLRAAGKMAPVAIARALNHSGDKARTAMIRAETAQTGLKRKVIAAALKSKRAAQQGGLSYTITSRGGNVRLKFFSARETRKGVSAAPWNARQVYAGTFMKGGRFPNRVAAGLHGNVFVRTGKSRLPIRMVKSGLFIPTEMVTGQTAAAFHTTVAISLEARLSHELAPYPGRVGVGWPPGGSPTAGLGRVQQARRRRIRCRRRACMAYVEGAWHRPPLPSAQALGTVKGSHSVRGLSRLGFENFWSPGNLISLSLSGSRWRSRPPIWPPSSG